MVSRIDYKPTQLLSDNNYISSSGAFINRSDKIYFIPQNDHIVNL